LIDHVNVVGANTFSLSLSVKSPVGANVGDDAEGICQSKKETLPEVPVGVLYCGENVPAVKITVG
jgi:hypothetical protein